MLFPRARNADQEIVDITSSGTEEKYEYLPQMSVFHNMFDEILAIDAENSDEEAEQITRLLEHTLATDPVAAAEFAAHQASEKAKAAAEDIDDDGDVSVVSSTFGLSGMLANTTISRVSVMETDSDEERRLLQPSPMGGSPVNNMPPLLEGQEDEEEEDEAVINRPKKNKGKKAAVIQVFFVFVLFCFMP